MYNWDTTRNVLSQIVFVVVPLKVAKKDVVLFLPAAAALQFINWSYIVVFCCCMLLKDWAMAS